MIEVDEIADEEPCPPPPEFAGAQVREMRIVNRKGLHARATAKFVQCVERFDAQIKVTRCGETVGGDSIMGILTLGAGLGSTISVAARGAQASAAEPIRREADREATRSAATPTSGNPRQDRTAGRRDVRRWRRAGLRSTRARCE